MVVTPPRMKTVTIEVPFEYPEVVEKGHYVLQADQIKWMLSNAVHASVETCLEKIAQWIVEHVPGVTDTMRVKAALSEDESLSKMQGESLLASALRPPTNRTTPSHPTPGGKRAKPS